VTGDGLSALCATEILSAQCSVLLVIVISAHPSVREYGEWSLSASLLAQCRCISRLYSFIVHDGYGVGLRSKEQGARSKEQGTRSKRQRSKAKGQGPRAKGTVEKGLLDFGLRTLDNGVWKSGLQDSSIPTSSSSSFSGFSSFSLNSETPVPLTPCFLVAPCPSQPPSSQLPPTLRMKGGRVVGL